MADTILDDVRTRLQQFLHYEGPIYELVVGQEYRVHAIEYWDRGFWFFIHSVPESDIPYPFPAEFFEIVEGSIPRGWFVEFARETAGVVLKSMSFEEWATDDSYYERLVDGDAESIEVYRRQSAGG